MNYVNSIDVGEVQNLHELTLGNFDLKLGQGNVH